MQFREQKKKKTKIPKKNKINKKPKQNKTHAYIVFPNNGVIISWFVF